MKKLLLLGAFALSTTSMFAQWTEGFDSGTTLPEGWAIINQGDDHGFVIEPPTVGAAQSGNNVASILYSSTAHNDYLITKPIAVQAGVSNQISFYVRSRSTTYLEDYKVLLSTTDQTVDAFTVVLQDTQAAPSEWTKLTFDLSAYEGQTVYVAVHATDTNKYELYVDSFVVDKVPTCAGEMVLSSSNTQPNSIDLSWDTVADATGYTIYYSTSSATPLSTISLDNTNSVTVDGTTTSVTLTGLQAATAYNVWGRVNCGTNDFGGWNAPLKFTTECGTPTAGYIQDFTTFLPNCWTDAKGGDPTTGYTSVGNSQWRAQGFLNDGNSGATKISIWGTNRIHWLVSPTFNLSDPGSYVVSFDYALTKDNAATPITLGSDDQVLVLVSSDDGATWSVAKTWGASNSPLNVLQTAYISLDAHASATTKIAFYATSGTVNDYITSDFFVDNFKVIPTPACVPPANATVSNIETTTASVSWDASITTVGEGYTIYYTTEYVVPTADTVLDTTNSVTVAGTETSATLTGLLSGTTYYAWIKSKCTATEGSDWAIVDKFKTVCTAYMPGYTEDFNEFLPNCWSEAKGGDPVTGYTSTESSGWKANNFLNQDDAAVKVQINGTDKREWLISPIFDLSGGGSYVMSCDYAVGKTYGSNPSGMGSDDKVIVLVSNDNGTTWQELHTWDSSNAPSNTRQNIYLDLTSYASATTKIAFYATSGDINNSEYYNFYIDNFKVIPTPSCVEPTGVTSANVGAHTADISWNASLSTVGDGYTIYYSTEDTAPTADTVLDATNSATVAGTETSATITGLQGSTNYYVWVKANCSSTESSIWSAYVTFKTLCGAYEPGYTQDFASYSATLTSTPDCWFEAKGGDPATGYTSEGNTSWLGKGFLNSADIGAAKINIYYKNNKSWLVSPAFNLPAGETYILSFDYALVKEKTSRIPSAMGSDDKIIVLISNDGGTTWQELQTWDASNVPSSTRSHFVSDISTYTSANTRIAFYATDGTVYDDASYDFFMDNFKIEIQAACPAPMGIEASNITGSSAVVSWAAITETSSVTAPESYTVYYSTENVAPTTATTLDNTNSVTVSGTDNTTTLVGLQPETFYYIWVKANCSATSSSDWSFSNRFKTVCLSKVPEYTEDFSSFLPACWTEAKGGNPTIGYAKSEESYWAVGNFLNTGELGAAKIFLSYHNSISWLISPILDLSDTANMYTLSFDYGVTKYGGTEASAMGSDDKVIVLISNDNGVTWQEVQIWDASNGPSNTLNTFTLDITDYASATTKIAFYATDGTVDDEESYNFYIDNFKIETSPNTGTIEQELADLEIYPNPATDVINISNDKVIDTVEVYDINGRRIINKNIGDVRTSVQVNHLATGTYFVKVSSNGKTVTKQVIVK